MGNYISCTLSTHTGKHSNGAKVIFPDGEIRQFDQLINAAELMLETPNHFLVNSLSLQIGRRFSPLSADEDLEMGNVYVMFPMRRVNSAIVPADMGRLLMTANSAARRASGVTARISPECDIAAQRGMGEEVKLDLDEIEDDGLLKLFCGISSDKEELDAEMEAPDAEVEAPTMGLQSYGDVTYTNELANLLEHGHLNDIWLGSEVMKVVASWTRELCMNISEGHALDVGDDFSLKPGSHEEVVKSLSNWSVLYIGTGKGLLLQELAKQGKAAIDLARNLAVPDRLTKICFLVYLLNMTFELITKTAFSLSAFCASPFLMAGVGRVTCSPQPIAIVMIMVITSSNSTKDELAQEVEAFYRQHLLEPPKDPDLQRESTMFQYLSYVQKCPISIYGGMEGSPVSTVAFIWRRNVDVNV
ncbi:hypothetical protein AAC387_Pa05g3228 [Persea americana]